MLVAPAGLLRRNWYLPAVGLAALVAGFVLERALEQQGGEWGLALQFIGLFFALATLTRNSHPLARHTTVRASPEGLAIEGRAALAPGEVVEAKLVPKPGKQADTVAALTLRGGGTLSLWMRGADARALLERLGCGPEQRRASFRLTLRYRVRLLASLLGAALPYVAFSVTGVRDPYRFAVLFSSVLVGSVFALGVAALLGFVRGRVVIGSDGLRTRWFFLGRFVPFTEVASVQAVTPPFARGVVDSRVTLRSGRRLYLRTPEVPDGEAQRGAEGRALFEHLAEAYARFQRRPSVADLRAALGRGGRTEAAWLAHLDALVRGGATRYRVAELDPEQLAEVARDPSSPGDCRVGAAAALLRLDGGNRERVRLAAEACAHEELQAALAALSAAEDEAGFEAALARAQVLPSGSGS